MTESVLQPVPLYKDDEGVWRVTGSRLSLDVIVGKYWAGWSAEQISDAHPALALSDVYALIAWYLSNRTAVDAYLEARRREAQELRREVESQLGRAAVVERLSAVARPKSPD